MISRQVVLPPAPLEPAPLDLRWPLGLALDMTVKFLNFKNEVIDMTTALSQFVLFPRSRGGTHPYDMTVYDGVNGILQVQIPGNDLIDDKGYNIEIYARSPNPVEGDSPIPESMPVRGSLVTYGQAYTNTGPLSKVSIPTIEGPPGPPGPTGAIGPTGEPGADGQRGTMWFTGNGDPTLTGDFIYNDMYLDMSNGAVWQYRGGVWVHT